MPIIQTQNKDVNSKLSGIDVDGSWTGEFDFVTGIDLSGGDVALTTQQSKAGIIEVDTGHATNNVIIAATDATPGKIYIVVNNHATLAANIKVAGGTAVTVAALKSAMLRIKKDGTQVLRVTPDT